MKFRLMDGTHAEEVGWRLPDGRIVEKLERGQEDRAVPEIRRWQVTRDAKGNVYQPVIECKKDLHAAFDINPDFPPKFVRLPDDWIEPEPVLADTTGAVEGLTAAEVKTLRELMTKAGGASIPVAASAGAIPTPVASTGASTLEAMTFEKIKEWAEQEEVNLGGAKNKDEAMKVLRKAGLLK